MPATTQAELLAITEKEYAKLRKLIDTIPEAQALKKREEETSIKDVIGHRAHWAGLFFVWYDEAQATGHATTPAPGYKWNELKRYNADLRKGQASLGWEDVKALLDENHRRLVRFIEDKDDAALYGGPMIEGGNGWTTGRWAEASGPSHYRSAGKWIRACLKADT